MPLISQSIERIRVLINDLKTDAQGNLRPDFKYSDETILIEIQSALRELLKKNPEAFFPAKFSAAHKISALALSSDFPVIDEYIPGIEKKASAILESTDQEGARPEAIARVNV